MRLSGGGLANPFEGFIGDEILRVDFANGFAVIAFEREPLVVIVEVSGEVTMGVALAIVAEEVVETDFEGAACSIEHAHAPFADAGGLVTGLFEELGHGNGGGGQRHLAFGLDLAVGADRAMAHVQAGHQRGTGGSADAGAGVGLGEAHALGCHAVEVRRLNQLLPVATDVAHGEVIGEDEDEVGFFGSG